MRTKISKANLSRLASLSALGAGTLAATVGTAEASSIVFSGPVNARVGSCPGCLGGFTMAGPDGVGGALVPFRSIATTEGVASLWVVDLYGKRGAHGTRFEPLGTRFLSAFPVGARWGSRKPAGRYWFVGGIYTFESIDRGTIDRFNPTDEYLLFRFDGGRLPRDLYGWAQLSVSIKTPHDVEVTVVDWAYDASGAQIPAGDTGTPEPSTFVLAGLAALALGAKGLRAWRLARKTSPSSTPIQVS